MAKFYSLSFFLPLFFFAFPALSQHQLQGKILDTQREPIAFANLILLNAQDSTSVYKGAVSSENGEFKIENIEENSYLLKVSFVGFQDFLKEIKVSKKLNLGTIILQEDAAMLKEVSINYKNPSVKREVDRLVFRVENTTLSAGTSWDILKKTPGVILSGENLMVRNQGVQVYINDRKVQLTASELKTLLENYPAENIVSVEVITTPPARYDAEGGAVLNIITSKSIAPGYKGNVNGAWTQGVYPKFQLGTSHYYKTEKLNLFANYSFSPRKEFKEDFSYINYKSDYEIPRRWETDFERTTRSKAHNANLMLDYHFDDRNVLNFSSAVTISPNKTFDNKVQTQIFNNNEPGSILTNSDLSEDLSNVALDLEFTHTFNNPAAKIAAKTHFTRFDQDRTQYLQTDTRTGEFINDISEFNTLSNQGINIFTAQLDYITPLGSTNFESGLKVSVINSDSRILYDGDIASQDDHFLYDENIYAAYASVAKDWKSWSAKAGLRAELTNRTGNSITLQEKNERENLELFPTVYLQHRISENHSLSFDYSRRIDRPKYASLNPFRYYLTENDYNSGNPNLHAAVSNNFTLGYALKSAYFFDFYYRNNGKIPETLSFQDNEAYVIRRLSVNLEEAKSYGLDITHGRSVFNWWYAYLYASIFHEERSFLAVESNNVPVSLEIDGFYGSLYNSFILSKDGNLTGEITLLYVSDWLVGSYKLDPMTTLSFGLRKTFWNNRAELSLNLEDALNQTNTWMRTKYLNQDNGFFAKPESRTVRLGFKYNFGNFRLSDNQRAIDAAERERL